MNQTLRDQEQYIDFNDKGVTKEDKEKEMSKMDEELKELDRKYQDENVKEVFSQLMEEKEPPDMRKLPHEQKIERIEIRKMKRLDYTQAEIDVRLMQDKLERCCD